MMKPATEGCGGTSLRAMRGCTGLPALLALLALLACGDAADLPEAGQLASFRVTLDAGTDAGSAADPLPFPTESRTFSFSVEAVDRFGDPIPDYDGVAELRFVPGDLQDGSDRVTFSEGRAAFSRGVRFAYGQTRLRVRDLAREEGGAGRFAAGVSPVLFFDNPRVRNVRENPDDPSALSPLFGQEARIDEGVLVITNIVANGFYVSDLQGPGEPHPALQTGPVPQYPWQSLFVFTFNFPVGVEIGDRLCTLSGGVAEFQSQTQLTFPNWSAAGRGGPVEFAPEDFVDDEDLEVGTGAPPRCPQDAVRVASEIVPEPFLLDAALLADDLAIRAWDSALVRVEGARMHTRFDDCDFDGSGQVESASERACRSRCQQDPTCTELSGFRSFDQFGAVIDGVTIELAELGRAADFDPLEGCTFRAGNANDPASDPPGYRCPAEGRDVLSLTGTLRLIELGPTLLLKAIVPRTPQDLILDSPSR